MPARHSNPPCHPNNQAQRTRGSSSTPLLVGMRSSRNGKVATTFIRSPLLCPAFFFALKNAIRDISPSGRLADDVSEATVQHTRRPLAVPQSLQQNGAPVLPPGAYRFPLRTAFQSLQ